MDQGEAKSSRTWRINQGGDPRADAGLTRVSCTLSAQGLLLLFPWCRAVRLPPLPCILVADPPRPEVTSTSLSLEMEGTNWPGDASIILLGARPFS